MSGDFSGETAAFYARFRRGYPPAFTGLLAMGLVIANGTPLWQQAAPWSQAVRHALEQWLGVRLASCCGTDAASREGYQAAMLAAGFTGVHETTFDYTARLTVEELIGALYSAMPSRLLPAPAERAAFADHIRTAMGAGDAIGDDREFAEQVHVAALIGYSPSPARNGRAR